MDFTFYGGPWPEAKPSVGGWTTIAGGIPVRREEAKTATRATPKVVQIPVHFVGSESVRDRSKSASKIQKVFRGFLVRKCVRKIAAIKREVDEIEGRVWRSEEVELMRKDGKERLKVNETLMGLLFRLDSVMGVDPGVRDLRKAVIRKAIALQERVDAIAAAAASSSSADIDGVHRETETPAEGEKDHQARDQVLEIQYLAAAAGNSTEASNSEDQPLEIRDLAVAGNSAQDVHFSEAQVRQNSDVVDSENGGSARGTEKSNNNCGVESGARICEREDGVGSESEMNAKEGRNCVEDAEEVGIDSEMKEACLDKDAENDTRAAALVVDSLMKYDTEGVREKTPALSECVEETVETSQMEVGTGGEEEKEGRNYLGDDNKTSSELLDKMAEENEKMMKLMTQLNERNEVQTQMLNALAHRVEQLEKAIVCDKMKRRKKKRHSG